MASDLASRIKARFTRRRPSTISSSLPSSRSGLGESSILTAPSQSSREPSFLSHSQLTASQTSDDHSEIPSPGAPGDINERELRSDQKKKRLSLLHVSKGRNIVSSSSVGGRNESINEHRDEDYATVVAAGAPHAHLAMDLDAGGPSPPPAHRESSRGRSSGLRRRPGSPEQQLQGCCHSSPQAPANPAPSQAATNGIDAVPPRLSASRSHPQLPQQSRPSPIPSPVPCTAKTPISITSNYPRGPPGNPQDSQPRDTSVGSSGASVPVASTPAPTHTGGDDLEVDPLLGPHHGREPDSLRSASHPASALALAASSTQTPTPDLGATVDQHSPRRQSLFASRQTSLVRTLLRSNQPIGAADTEPRYSIDANMVTRKIWVKRAHASATTITINEDDLVDDVRDMILRKYANSLGRTFDSPDLVIRLHPRDQEKERTLGPEEVMARTLDTFFPGGQTVDEALVIDIPRKPPKASPRVLVPPGTTTYYITDDGRPSEAGEGYFPPIVAMPSPHPPHSVPAIPDGTTPHSMAVLGTGHIPPIPSPGGTRTRMHRERSERPRLGRTHTSSPTILASHTPGVQSSAPGCHSAQNCAPLLPHSRTHSSSSDRPTGVPTVKSTLPKSPAPEATPAKVATPPPRPSSPRASSTRPRRSKKSSEYPNPANMLNGSVPPINVLIVEDNPINLKLLEAFVKRLKVRWQTAMNGRDAVKKWRTGGFHLVLMDIQLPVMNGLDATREIRRLERVNSIGVFSSSTSDNGAGGTDDNELKEQDRLENLSLFKSPVIIVALTASSLQSDRHEALAAGCNDFLTKVGSIFIPTARRPPPKKKTKKKQESNSC